MDIWGALTACSVLLSLAAFAWSWVGYRRVCRAGDRIEAAQASIRKSLVRIDAAEARVKAAQERFDRAIRLV